jgi:hypothetical protein
MDKERKYLKSLTSLLKLHWIQTNLLNTENKLKNSKYKTQNMFSGVKEGST